MSREFTHTDESALPVWLGEKEKINEPLFCEELLKDKQLRYINGSFFSTMGAVDENELSAQIYKTISPYVTSNVSRHTENIMKALKLRCFGTDIIALPDEIHILNGVLKTDGTFIPEIRFCAHRMNVNYNPDEKNHPIHFLKFLNDMLDSEDIVTLQEYLGYCLIPLTNAQKISVNTKEANTNKANTKEKKAAAPKKAFAEKVHMTEEQYQSLSAKYSKEFADKCIEELDLYKQSSGRTYKSDYHAILHWVVDKVKKSFSFAETPTFSQPVCENSPDVNPFDAMLGGMWYGN